MKSSQTREQFASNKSSFNISLNSNMVLLITDKYFERSEYDTWRVDIELL